MEKLFKPVIDWHRTLIPPQERTVNRFISGVLEEGQEFTLEGIAYDGTAESKKRLADEGRDVIIRTGAIIKELLPEVDLDQFVGEKIDVMVNKKYPVNVVKRHMSTGLTYDQAMAARKKEWTTPSTNPY